MSRARFVAVLGTTCAVVALLLPRPQASGASDLGRWRGRIADDRSRVARAGEQLRDSRQQLARTIRERDSMLGEVQERLVSLYKVGSPSTATAIATGDMDGAYERADVLMTVAQHDSRMLRHYQQLQRLVPVLQGRIAHATGDLASARKALRRDTAAYQRAQAAERARIAALRARAARLAERADVPLTPAAVAPETVVSHEVEPAAPAAPPSPAGFSQTGTASMYADSFAGKPTASGEPYDPNALTAAHPTLPLGTMVTVTGPGGSVMVRINDRGPYAGGRIIDLSRAAANAIGLGGLGTVTITVQS